MPVEAVESKGLDVSPWQRKVLAVPQGLDLALLGGRGSSKTFAAEILILRHVEEFGDRARVLFIRKTYKGLADFENLCRDVFPLAYGTKGASYNASEHVWRFGNGGYVELGQLETEADYSKYQGRSFTLLIVDEAGQYPSPELLDRLRSNLRAQKGTPIRMVIIANPGGVGHSWLSERYAHQQPWRPFTEEQSGRTWVYAPSTFMDNPHIDRVEYRRQLAASCPHDPELLEAWLTNNWAINRGAYFAGCVSDENRFGPWPAKEFKKPRYRDLCEGDPLLVAPRDWLAFLAADWGSDAPTVVYLCLLSPGAKGFGPDCDRWFSRDSILLVDELTTCQAGSVTKGTHEPIPLTAERIRRMCATWGVKAWGYLDDACFANHGSAAGSIADEFRRAKVHFQRARKADRIGGWETLRRMLGDAGKLDRPGLFVSRKCVYWWATTPTLARDPRRPEDVDSRGPDHGADACRYAVVSRMGSRAQSIEFRI